MAFSRSGDLLASYGHDKTVRLWDHRTAAMLTIPEARRWVGFSRDDRILTAQGQGTRLGSATSTCRPNSACLKAIPPPATRLGLRRPFPSRGSPPRHTGRPGRRPDLGHGRRPGGRLHSHRPGGRFPLREGWRRPPDLRLRPAETMADRVHRPRPPIGPPRRLLTFGRVYGGRMAYCGTDSSGSRSATISGASTWSSSAPSHAWCIVADADGDFIAASPDGRWVATGSWSGPGFQVWDTLKRERTPLWRAVDADVAFSPDGRWLVTGTGGGSFGGAECIFWRVGTWGAARASRWNGPPHPARWRSATTDACSRSCGR